MPDPTPSIKPVATKPDYANLLRFLILPLLDTPDALRVDCEAYGQSQRVWVRVAFEQSEKGRVFGRGGRNIQAIRSVLGAAARAANQSVHLDIYGSGGDRSYGNGDGGGRRGGGRGRRPRRPTVGS
ncbi:putative RNA-binding protein (contains KH domain protein) [Rubidibacter lacunae KORDI 51-2]|uniref:Putative RNA-binding protein (Contains KH domain protein) n=1 Tax=Rubidibacter lacunae KORDI 51-2 TaxID=582515 RepID=U5DQ19_9CHRO|nr:KH domain-containing protein [Rubidibacter lacunae]ERN41795.1 putative RNA-binding protein (contains KH domain protein) [Rubidibacter lacunae KORDI 51-2]